MVERHTFATALARVPPTHGFGRDAAGILEFLTEDPKLLELEAWYWAWRSHLEAAESDDEGDRSIDEMLLVIDTLTALPAQSMTGVAAKLRVLRDIMEPMEPLKRPEMDEEARLLDAVVGDANRLAESSRSG
jgi:hypothetical protein